MKDDKVREKVEILEAKIKELEDQHVSANKCLVGIFEDLRDRQKALERFLEIRYKTQAEPDVKFPQYVKIYNTEPPTPPKESDTFISLQLAAISHKLEGILTHLLKAKK